MNQLGSANPASREPLKLSVQFKKHYSRSELTGELMNISLTGAFLGCEKSGFEVQDRIHISFHLEKRKRIISATIVWKNSKGFGVKFHPQDQQDQILLQDLIYFVTHEKTQRRSLIENIFKKIAV